jgi:hypothetical protein
MLNSIPIHGILIWPHIWCKYSLGANMLTLNMSFWINDLWLSVIPPPIFDNFMKIPYDFTEYGASPLLLPLSLSLPICPPICLGNEPPKAAQV